MSTKGKVVGFTLSLDITVDLDLDDLWPDGNAPENPTTDDVRELIRRDGGAHRVLNDWNLVDRFDEFFIYPLRKEKP